MIDNLAPIVLFLYNRPEHARQTLEALSKNKYASESSLYIFADGPKQDASSEQLSDIKRTIEVAGSKKWCKEVVIIESKTNKGLAGSIVDGVTAIVNKFGKVIVLEDDLQTSVGFLEFMNEALIVYEKKNEVMHISGYMYPLSNREATGTVFLRVLSCWGWATWKRSWDFYSNDVEEHLRVLNSMKKTQSFNVLGNGPFYDQLVANLNGKLNTWAVRWFASWFLKGGYALFPRTTLVVNIGHDGTGVHCGKDDHYSPKAIAKTINVREEKVVEDKRYLRLIDDFYKRISAPKNSLKIDIDKVILNIKIKIKKLLDRAKG